MIAETVLKNNSIGGDNQRDNRRKGKGVARDGNVLCYNIRYTFLILELQTYQFWKLITIRRAWQQSKCDLKK